MMRQGVREQPTATWFGDVVDRLSAIARAWGLIAPGYRSPPRLPNVSRSIGRRPDGGVVVAVATHGRRRDEIVADLVEGLVVANRLEHEAANEVRRCLMVELSEPEVVMRAA